MFQPQLPLLGFSLPNAPLPSTGKDSHFKFEPFLRKEYGLGLNPDRPVCNFWITSGECPNGTNCENKHVSKMFSNKIVCKHWLRGLCKKGDDCEFLHEYNFRKLPECVFFSKNGFCTQTPECLYLHIDPQTKVSNCPNYEQGFCPDGPKCSRRHIRKVACQNYMTGFCPLGKNCELAHPKYDPNLIQHRMLIRSDEQIIKDKEEEEAKQKLRQEHLAQQQLLQQQQQQQIQQQQHQPEPEIHNAPTTEQVQ